MGFDPAALRRQFPILARPVHGKALHYLDNGATAQMPQAVLDAVIRHETHARANVLRSVHYLAEAATEAYEAARATMARYLNARAPEEVVFTSGCTAAINLVAHSFVAGLQPGDEVLISLIEHHANFVPWQMARERRGIVLKAIPVTADGRLDLAALERLVTPRTRLISLTHASNVTGAETDVATVVAAARTVGARVMLDGAQRAPHGPLDVQALGIDFYALAGHKMFGPNGVGVLWGRRELLAALPPFLGGGEMIARVRLEETTYAEPPHRFEAGTPPIAQAVGLAAAAEWIGGLDHEAVHAHLSDLTGRLLDGLGAVDKGRERIRVIGPAGLQARLPIVSFAVAGAHPHDICQILDHHGVALRGGHHCAQPLMDAFGIGGTTRASLACYNDAGDIDALLTGLDDALHRLTR
ncbi:MAG TPA: SufS family cysteine desulfurase [Candidatus Sulfotelmatobacter sp.]|nr:SufS family cysteine desulfurase [Candidatus Sulfotelmatobacter sp.]